MQTHGGGEKKTNLKETMTIQIITVDIQSLFSSQSFSLLLATFWKKNNNWVYYSKDKPMAAYTVIS